MRAALDTYGVPYTYFGDIKLREGNLRAKYDVIIFPHVGGNAQSQVNGIPQDRRRRRCRTRRPTARRTSARRIRADDIRGGMGWEGLMELVKFVREGGTLITEGSTATIFPEYNMTSAASRSRSPTALFARGSIMRGVVSRSHEPDRLRLRGRRAAGLLQPGPGAQRERRRRRGGFGGGGGGDPGVGQNTHADGDSPQPHRVAAIPRRSRAHGRRRPQAEAGGRRFAADGGGRGGRGGSSVDESQAARASCCRSRAIPTTCCCRARSPAVRRSPAARRLSTRRSAQGHVVMFAIRPFWRWQTQGTFFLGFNAILNWNDLDAGKPAARTGTQE